MSLAIKGVNGLVDAATAGNYMIGTTTSPSGKGELRISFVGHEQEQAELENLLNEVSDDFQSRAAVNAYIMAKKGQSYQQYTQAPPGDGKMSASQAYEILGLEPDASEDEIKHAHKRLMQKLHPDRGGSIFTGQACAARGLKCCIETGSCKHPSRD